MAVDAAEAPPGFDACARRVAAAPGAYESYRCYFEVASAQAAWEDAERQLAALAGQDPGNDWIVFVRALVTLPFDRTRAEQLYLESAERFQRAGNRRGELLARSNLQAILYRSGRIASAGRQVDRVSELGADAPDLEQRTRARIVEAQFLIQTGADLGRAERALLEAHADLAEAPNWWLSQHVVHGLGSVMALMGRYDEALAWFDRLLAQADAQGDLAMMALAHAESTNVLTEKRGELPGEVSAADLGAAAEATLTAARRAQDLELELVALRLLGEVLLTSDPDRAVAYIDTCVQQAGQQERARALGECLWIRARLLAPEDPDAARRAIDEAIALLSYDEGADHGSLAYAWRHAMRVAWQTQPAEEAIATSRLALAAIERLRNLQPALQSRSAAFSAWTRDYTWLSGRLLHRARQIAAQDGWQAPAARALLATAFETSERMRARSLLDRLSVASGLEDADPDAVARQARARRAIVDVNRRLLEGGAGTDSPLWQELAALEREEAAAREARGAAAIAQQVVTLAAAQQALAPDEALLLYQFGERDGAAGGSWVVTVTRGQVRAAELPERSAIEESLAMFRGVVAASSALLGRASSGLFERLLRPAIDGLPDSVTRLVVVPDASLAITPVAALGPASPASVIIDQFQVELAPSASIWRHWRERLAGGADAGVLVLADPALEAFAGGIAEPLGPLPYARAEGADIARRLPDRTTVWSGPEASEARLKELDLNRYRVLHFASHALIDSTHPERSAILLASGAGSQDGLLQSREIADLALNGQLVVLSSCQSAAGTVLRGEGVLGLARAFFAGGARVVIGSLWPVRDDHGRAFFEPFYRALAQGLTVGAAFRAAQQVVRAEGLPVQVWAGFVLMGDPETMIIAPAPARSRPSPAAAAGLLILAAVLLLAAFGWRRFRTTRF